MKIRFIFLNVLIITSLYAGEEQKKEEEINMQQVLLTSLIALDVYNQTVIQDDAIPAEKTAKPLVQKQKYKLVPKHDKQQRRKQTNRPIQQYRRR